MRIVIAVMLMMAAPLVAAEVVQARLAAYEVARFDEGRREVLAQGEVLLKLGHSVTIGDAEGQDAPDVGTSRVRLAFTAMPMAGQDGRVWLASRVAIVHNRGLRRVQIGPAAGADDSFITADDVSRIRFESRVAASLADPSPIELTHEAEGARFIVTLMPLPGH